MSADAAMASGAGRATVGSSLDVIRALTGEAYEVMGHAIFELDQPSRLQVLHGFDALVVGPGFCSSNAADDCLIEILEFAERPQVIDAGALSRIASESLPWPSHSSRVITPHPGEAARLLGCSTESIQRDRIRPCGHWPKSALRSACSKGLTHWCLCLMVQPGCVLRALPECRPPAWETCWLV